MTSDPSRCTSFLLHLLGSNNKKSTGAALGITREHRFAENAVAAIVHVVVVFSRRTPRPSFTKFSKKLYRFFKN
jgi:hypothetical protein